MICSKGGSTQTHDQFKTIPNICWNYYALIMPDVMTDAIIKLKLYSVFFIQMHDFFLQMHDYYFVKLLFEAPGISGKGHNDGESILCCDNSNIQPCL